MASQASRRVENRHFLHFSDICARISDFGLRVLLPNIFSKSIPLLRPLKAHLLFTQLI